MIVRFELGEVRKLLVAYLERKPAVTELPAVVEQIESPQEEPSVPVQEPQPETAPAGETPQTADAAVPAEIGSNSAAGETARLSAAASREKTEAAMSALIAEARGEGIIIMGLRAHLDPYFIVSTYAEVLGLSEREASAAFQAYIRQHPPSRKLPSDSSED